MKSTSTPAALTIVAALVACGLAAGQTPWQSVSLEDIEFDFRLIRDVDRIEQMLGDRLDQEFTLVEFRLRALYGTKVDLNRKDFVLQSFNGNESSSAQSPERIAGDAVLALGQRRGGGGGIFSREQAGIPTTGGVGGPPGRIGSTMPTGVGSAGGPVVGDAEVSQRKIENDGTLVGRLRSLELPLDAGDRDVDGYLYFQVPPKHKLKHLSLSYDGPYGQFKAVFKK